MFNITGGEMLIILLVALVILGPDRLPELARSAGRMINKVKTMTEGLQSGVSGVMDDPAMQPLKDLSELATRPRQKLAEYALEAEAEERAKREAKKQAADEPVEPPVETVEPVEPPVDPVDVPAAAPESQDSETSADPDLPAAPSDPETEST